MVMSAKSGSCTRWWFLLLLSAQTVAGTYLNNVDEKIFSRIAGSFVLKNIEYMETLDGRQHVFDKVEEQVLKAKTVIGVEADLRDWAEGFYNKSRKLWLETGWCEDFKHFLRWSQDLVPGATKEQVSFVRLLCYMNMVTTHPMWLFEKAKKEPSLSDLPDAITTPLNRFSSHGKSYRFVYGEYCSYLETLIGMSNEIDLFPLPVQQEGGVYCLKEKDAEYVNNFYDKSKCVANKYNVNMCLELLSKDVYKECAAHILEQVKTLWGIDGLKRIIGAYSALHDQMDCDVALASTIYGWGDVIHRLCPPSDSTCRLIKDFVPNPGMRGSEEENVCRLLQDWQERLCMREWFEGLLVNKQRRKISICR